MKNIVIFTNTLLSGGAEKQAVLLAKALKDKYNVWLVVYYGNQVEEKFLKIIEDNGIKTFFLHGHHFTKLFKFLQFLKKERIEVIFSYLLTTNLINGLIGKIAGVKFRIGGIRSSMLEGNKEHLQKLVQNYLTTITIYNNSKGNELLIKKGFQQEKSIVIPNCFELENYRIIREIKKQVTIISVGRFHRAKDYRTALKSINILKLKRVDFKYKLIGHGSLEVDIRTWVKEYQLENEVEVIINPPNLNDYYIQADVYLMTSIFEGLSNTVLEAMSFSLPLVITDVGDNNRLVENGLNGYLCEVGNAEMIANKLEYFIHNYDKRIEFGLNSYKKLKENYSFEKFQQRYFEFIDGLSSECHYEEFSTK